MEKTWKPTTAGILAIIGGAIGAGFAGCTGCVGAGLVGLGTLLPAIGWPVGLFGTALIAIPVTLVVIALVGGSYALARKRWGLAFAGAICACFPVVPLGVLSIIFVSLGKKEFA